MAESQVSTVQTEGNDFLTGPESKIIEQTIKRAVRAAYTTGRELGFTEDQIQALGNGIKEICTKYMEEQTRPKITREGNLHWTEDQVDAMRILWRRTRERVKIDLAQYGAGHDVRTVAFESCHTAFYAVLDHGIEIPFEVKTPKQQAATRRAEVIDITPRFREYLTPRFQTN